jgi:hypothetical protein
MLRLVLLLLLLLFVLLILLLPVNTSSTAAAAAASAVDANTEAAFPVLEVVLVAFVRLRGAITNWAGGVFVTAATRRQGGHLKETRREKRMGQQGKCFMKWQKGIYSSSLQIYHT